MNYSKTKAPNKRKNHAGKGGRGGRPNARRFVSKLDPALLVKKAMPKEESTYVSERSIQDLPISQQLKQCLDQKGFIRPTEIQDRSLESALEGRDILGIAQTGTGKTGAFLMPIIERFIEIRRLPNAALIVVPTRELALQVKDEFRSMTKGMGMYAACFIGGTNIRRDLDLLKKKNQLIIGTPGRLLDLEGRGAINFASFETLVLDEFDRMLDMGFSKDMDKIIGGMHNRTQTMLFSATLDHSQKKRIDEILDNPFRVKISQGDTSGDHIEQKVIKLSEGEDKFKTLVEMLNQSDFAKVLIFDETKHRVKRLCKQLNNIGINSGQIQGNMSQNARQVALNAFKHGKTRVLVASDVAARGIDVKDITHVINYQLPQSYDSYIHRIGRTGRAGSMGMAYTFVS